MNQPPLGISAQPIQNNFFQWNGMIQQLYDTPYQDGIFFVSIKLPKDYPFRPMKIRFLTKIYHINITQTGFISINTLADDWSPVFTIGRVLSDLRQLLMNPNPDSPMRPQIARLYIENKSEYQRICRQQTKKYAR